MKIRLVRINKNAHSPSYKDIIRSKMSQKQINSNISIKNAIEKIKKIKLNYLTRMKPKESLSKSNDEILDTKRAKLISNLDTFQQTFYDFNKSLKKNKDKRSIKTLTSDFTKKYDLIKNNSLFSRKEMLDEIKEIYHKKNITLPLLQNQNGTKNLFTKNLLLLKGDDIKTSVTHNIFNERSNNKSILYFKKMEDNIMKVGIKKIHNELKGINDEIEQMLKRKSETIDVELKNRNSIINQEKIEKSMNDINKINDTMNNIEDIDFFFESSNQEYLKYLKGDTSKNISKYSTKHKTGFSLFKDENLKNKINSNKGETIKNNTSKSFYIVEKKSDNIHMSNISNIKNKNRKSCFNIKSNDFNNTFQIDNNKTKNRNKTKTLINKQIKIYNNPETKIENLYNKIKDLDDLKRSSILIKNSFPNKKFDDEKNILPINIYNNYQNTRKNILRSTCYKTYSKLKYKTGLDMKDTEYIELKEKENELKLKTLEEKMGELVGKLN